MTKFGTAERPLRVAIVGSGPSGFYAAEALFKTDTVAQVDLFERLPTPFGLVRLGVAPDHPKIKSVTRVFDKIAGHERFRFLGNVTVGRDISVGELRAHYDAVVFTSGAESDRRLGIPGEDLPGSHTATEFVAWYNGHPEYRDRVFDLSQEVAVVIGQGNVAMDVTRILAKTVEELKQTDIAEHALETLAHSKIRHIYLVGRRGPVQAAFTQAEIREMGELTDCDPVVDPADLVLNAASQAELADPDNSHSHKNYAVLQAFAARPAPTKHKQCHVQFYKSPVEIRGTDRVQRIVLERNALSGDPNQQKARGTGQRAELDCGLVFRSVGYRGVAIPGLPFDAERGIIPNVDGRITDSGAVQPGLYVAGWIKRGPSGVIGTNKPDSAATIASILADLPTLTPCPTRDPQTVHALLASRQVRVVAYADWQKIDAAEIERGKARNKPREKFTRIDEMLAVLG